MKILLINPPFEYPSPDLLVKEPLSLAYLASCLQNKGYKVRIFDAVARNVQRSSNGWWYGFSLLQISNEIKEYDPQIVGITCPFSLRIDSALEVAKIVKKVNKKIVNILGGIHPTIFPEETAKHKEVDGVIIGEGEETFLSLVKFLDEGGNIKSFDIDGYACRRGKKIINHPKFNYIKNLDLLPFPARDLLPMDFYTRKKTIMYGLGGGRSASIITSRSCPRRCTFCCMFQSHGEKWRGRSAQNVFEEIKILVNDYKVNEIFFMDDNLTYDKKRIIKLCKMIVKSRLKFKWNTPNGVAADKLDKNLMKLMKKSGCINLCIGIESGNEEVRNKIIKKGLPLKTIKKVLYNARAIDLPIIGFFIIGIPGDDELKFKDTLEMVKKLPFSMIATSFYTPFPGTKLYDNCVDKKYIGRNYWKKIKIFNAPIVETSDFNKKALKEWERRLYLVFFKSHFREIALRTITLKNDFINIVQIRRFVREKLALNAI